MTKSEFIQAIAPYVQKYTEEFRFGVPSAIIAQACLESAYGTSDKAKHHNYFGLKYRQGRVKCNSGYFSAGSSEQLASGAYIPISTDWYAFSNMEQGVRGYFEFIQSGGYASARAVPQTDPESYLTELKACGYATSLNYVTNVMKVVTSNNLKQYDSKKVSKTSTPTIIKHNNSTYHNTSVRYGAVQFIVVHYTADLGTAANHITAFSRQTSVNASADFFVDETGIYQYNLDLRGRYSWAVGGGRQSQWGGKFFGQCTNPNSISIEMCVKSNGGSLAANGSGWYLEEKTITNTVALVQYLMKEFSLPISRVIRHYDVTGKLCPGIVGWNTAAGNTEEKWIQFLSRVNGAPVVISEPVPYKVPTISYTIQTRNHGVLAATGNGAPLGFANDSILKIKLKVSHGKVQYRVHHLKGKWSRKVSGGRWCGDGVNSLDAIQIYYSTDTDETNGQYYEAVYAVKPYDSSGYLPEVHDTDWEQDDGENTAGWFGRPFTEIKVKLVKC